MLCLSRIRNAFGKITILEDKLEECIVRLNNLKCQLPFAYIKPILGNKTARFLIGMNFIKHKNDGIIVQEEIDYL